MWSLISVGECITDSGVGRCGFLKIFSLAPCDAEAFDLRRLFLVDVSGEWWLYFGKIF
jgi:hypothetical protein